MHKFFIAVYYFIKKNKVLAVLIALAYLLVFSFLFTRIKFDEDITKLIPHSTASDEATKVLSGMKFSDKIVVLISKENGNEETMTSMADIFLDSLKISEQYISSVQGQINEETFQEAFEFVYANLPLFLDSADYSHIKDKLQKDSLAKVVEGNYKALLSPTGMFTGRIGLQDPLGLTFMGLKKLQTLNAGDDFNIENGYLFTKDKKQLLLFINPILPGSETEKNTHFTEQLYEIQSVINLEFSGNARLDYYGASLIAVANAKQIKKDIQTTVIIALGILMLLLMTYYRKLTIPFILFVPTVFGVLFAIGVLCFVKDTISAISISIGAILLGVTLDYALHILTHYKHNNNIETLFKDITKPLIMSSSTTAVAFLCLIFVKSEALKDLGVFAAVAVLASAIFSLIIIPQLYTPVQNETSRITLLDKIARFPYEKSKTLLTICVLAIVVSVFTFSKVKFNEDISQLNFVPENIKNTEKKLEESTSLTSKSLYITKYSSSLDSVLAMNHMLGQELEQAKSEGKIHSYTSLGGLILSKSAQQKKIADWNSFWNKDEKTYVSESLQKEGAKFGFKPSAYQAFYDMLDTPHLPIDYTEYLNLKSLSIGDFFSNHDGVYSITSVVKIDEGKRDALVAAYAKTPETLVIDRQQLNETFLGQLKNDFTSLINLSFIAVLVILFLFFKRLEIVLVSAIPIALTAFVIAGIMGLFGIQLNIFSTIVCTLIFGIGVDFSIFMTAALQKRYTTGKDELPIFRTSIILAVLTTILAIGALVFAQHPALKSISLVSLIGIFTAVLITFVFYPILFKWVIELRPQKGKSPVRFGILFTSIISFIYYGLGGVLLSILSIGVSVWPGNKKKAAIWLRKFMSRYMKTVLDTNYNLKKTKIINPNNEDFKKPAVLIANHTCFLDILSMGMIHTKTIFLVSDWVYNSPIFGTGVRLMGFYPVSKGIDGGLEHLRPKIEEGYSIVVFPEGTRSTDNVVKRFHKGAFYLADYFNLDVLPILIHGGSEALPKGDFFIRKYRITLKILDRINPKDTHFGTDLKDRTKKIASYFKENYAQLRHELEGADYFRKIILENYIFKEKEVQEIVKKRLPIIEPFYYTINKLIPENARILHIADDFGEGNLILALQEATRKIDSWIENEDKRAIADHLFMNKNRHIKYLESLPETDSYDVLLITTEVELSQEFMDAFPHVINSKEYGNL